MRAKRAGWIQAAFIAAAISASPGAAQAAPATVTQPLNVRGGPGTAFPIINRLPAGSTVNTNGCSAGWCDIGADAFVSEAYLNFGGCACAQPVRPRVARPVKAPRPVVAAPPAVVVPVAVTAGPVSP